MTSDEERRDVARMLRAVAKKLGPNMDAHEFAHYTADVLDVGESMTWYEMVLSLADLIEPIIPADPGEAGLASVDAFIREHTEKPVNREALLKLADEMENDTWYESSFDHRIATCFARRIRKILKGES